jgi:hypothetical protein
MNAPLVRPPAWKRALRRARRRLHSLQPQCRPILNNPRSAVILFGPHELLELALRGCWPLTEPAIAYLSRPPANQQTTIPPVTPKHQDAA